MMGDWALDKGKKECAYEASKADNECIWTLRRKNRN